MVTIFSFDHMTGENREYQYCNMAPMLSRQASILRVTFFVFKSFLVFLGGNWQTKELKKLTILTRKLRSHVRILIHRAWPILASYCTHICKIFNHFFKLEIDLTEFEASFVFIPSINTEMCFEWQCECEYEQQRKWVFWRLFETNFIGKSNFWMQ